MSQRAGSRARGFLSRGALLSLLLHVHLLVPIGVVIWIYGGRQQAAREAQRAQEVDVEFQDATAAELPKDLPPIEPLAGSAASRRSRPKPSPDKRSKPDASRSPSSEKKNEGRAEKKIAKPEPEVVVPPLPPMPSRAAAQAHEKIVDLDNDKKVEPPPDAKYLAQNNNRADEETRARDTNLREGAEGEGAESAKSNREDVRAGAEKEKIAELEDQKSALGRKAPDVTPHENPQVAESQERQDRAEVAAGAARSGADASTS